ncbi:MAG: GntR family transcriptional regulator [Roseiarcus sp.]
MRDEPSRANVRARPAARRRAAARRRGSAATSVTERTYRSLLEQIESRQIQPGEVLEERRLAHSLNVSRTPLRSALSRLLGEGVLTRLSNGVPAVREISAGEFLELIHVRRILEGEASALAAGRVPAERLDGLGRRLAEIIRSARASKEQHWRLDDEVHDAIAEHCGNKSLAAFISDVRRRIRMCNIERQPARLVPACREHQEIVDALAAGDPVRARRAMVRHLDNVRRSFLRAFGSARTDG